MYVCMYDHTYSKGMNQPSKVANPVRGQLNREINIPLPVFASENLVSRDGFGSPVLHQPAHPQTQAESGITTKQFTRTFLPVQPIKNRGL